MFNLNAMVMELNRFAAYNNLSAVPTNPMDFAAGFFASTQIPFQSSREVPGAVPLRGVVGDPGGHVPGRPRPLEEIASLNNLRQPYVDEVGSRSRS